MISDEKKRKLSDYKRVHDKSPYNDVFTFIFRYFLVSFRSDDIRPVRLPEDIDDSLKGGVRKLIDSTL